MDQRGSRVGGTKGCIGSRQGFLDNSHHRPMCSTSHSLIDVVEKVPTWSHTLKLFFDPKAIQAEHARSAEGDSEDNLDREEPVGGIIVMIVGLEPH